MYKPQFRKSADIYAIIDAEGVMSYISFSAFWALQNMPNVERCDIAFRDNKLIDERTFEDIRAFGDSFTVQELAEAIEGFLPHELTWQTLHELAMRVPQVLSVNLLIL